MGELLDKIDKNIDDSESLAELFELEDVEGMIKFVQEVYERHVGGDKMAAIKELRDNASNDSEMALYLWSLSFLSGYRKRIPNESVTRLHEIAGSLNRALASEDCKAEVEYCLKHFDKLLNELNVWW